MDGFNVVNMYLFELIRLIERLDENELEGEQLRQLKGLMFMLLNFVKANGFGSHMVEYGNLFD